MGFGRVIKFAISAIAVTTLLSSVAVAQPLQKPLRWLGEGFSAGYNRCNPGPDVDYYNPWSAHNSMLISQLPQFQNQNFQSYNLNNIGSRPVYRGVPYSVYAAPGNQNNFGYGMHSVQNVQSTYGGSAGGGAVESSFEPYDMEDDEADEDESDVDDEWNDDDNDWDADEDDDKTENESTRIQAPVPGTAGRSAFSKAGFQSQPRTQQQNGQQNLFNPFPK